MKKILIHLTLMSICFSTTLWAWEFPIKPGTEGWKAVEGRQKRISLLQIPGNILHKLTTQELLELCLDFPYTPDVSFFDKPVNGLETQERNFNGFSELFRRNDVLPALLDKYHEYNPDNLMKEWSTSQKGRFKIFSSLIGLIGGYYIKTKPGVEIPPELLNAALAHYQKWLDRNDSFFMTINCSFLAAHICETLHSQQFRAKFQNNEKYHYFLETAYPMNKELVGEIIQTAKQL